jgi:phosphate transport system protein
MRGSLMDQGEVRRFERELEGIRSRVLQMGGVVEGQLGKAMTALVTGNQELAGTVVRNDVRVNALEVEIDEECTRIVAEWRPEADGLRLIMVVIKTINDLERIGDEIKRVGKMVHEEFEGALDEEMRQEFEHMGGLVREMLAQVLDAFARTDVHSAMEVVRVDDRVDLKYRVITRLLMTHMAENAAAIPTFMNLLWAARSLERVGDRCRNIAEYVIYQVLGKDVRHTTLEEMATELKSGRA